MIPADLYENIFCFLGKRDLFTVCVTCRNARYEAQRLLYRNVNFIECTDAYRQLNDWSRTMIKYPQLATMVRCLSLPGGVNVSASDGDTDQLRISFTGAIESITNLAELRILSIHDNAPISLLPWILQADTAFSLKAFHVELPHPSYLSHSIDVLSRQPEVRELGSCFGDETDIYLPDDLLPRLSTVHVRRWNTLSRLSPRPISRLYLGAHDSHLADHVTRDMQMTSQVFHDLKHLRFELGIVNYVSRWNKAPERLGMIAERAPNLKTLCFFNEDVLYGYNARDLVRSLSRFKCLETFVMDPVEEYFPSPSSWKFDSKQHCLEFAEMLMTACPSLRRIAFPIDMSVKRGWMEGGRRVASEMRGDCPRYVRSASGHAQLEGFDFSEDLKSYWKRYD